MTTSLWLDLDAPAWPALERDERADVLVIGGGMTGTSAALAAAQTGARVILLESTRVAGGASGRNVGFLLAGPEAYYAESVLLHGRALARDVWRLNRSNIQHVKALAQRLALSCDLEHTGSVVAALTPEERVTLEESARLLREDGFPAEVLSGAQTEERIRGRGLLAGLHTRDDGQVHPVKFVRGVADAAAGAGARVVEGARVLALEQEAQGWRARVEGGLSVRAPRVICGLNAYAPALLAFAAPRVTPVRGQALATARVEGLRTPCPVYADHGYLYVRSAGDRVIAGGMRYVARANEVGYEDVASEAVQVAIERETARHWPDTAHAPVTHRWSGIMGFSRDGRPWVGEVPDAPGLFSFFGCTGHGWGYGIWAGELLARAALGARVAIPPWCAMTRALVPAPLVA